MVTISRISSQKSGKRVNLYLDGQFFCGLDLSVALKHNLKVGQKLSEDKLTTLVNQSTTETFFQKALNFISYRPRSEKEVRDYLKRKHKKKAQDDAKGAALIDQSIKKLKKRGFLDDHDFAKWWIKQRLDFRPKGKIALKSELFKKGVDRKIIDDILKEISVKDELKAARRIYEKALKQLKSVEPKKRKQRLISRLSSRGFFWEVIKTLIDEKGI